MAAADSPVIEGKRDAAVDRSLRHVEKDILISKIIRKKAHEVCFEPYVRGQLEGICTRDEYDVYTIT